MFRKGKKQNIHKEAFLSVLNKNAVLRILFQKCRFDSFCFDFQVSQKFPAGTKLLQVRHQYQPLARLGLYTSINLICQVT